MSQKVLFEPEDRPVPEFTVNSSRISDIPFWVFRFVFAELKWYVIFIVAKVLCDCLRAIDVS